MDKLKIKNYSDSEFIFIPEGNAARFTLFFVNNLSERVRYDCAFLELPNFLYELLISKYTSPSLVLTSIYFNPKLMASLYFSV